MAKRFLAQSWVRSLRVECGASRAIAFLIPPACSDRVCLIEPLASANPVLLEDASPPRREQQRGFRRVSILDDSSERLIQDLVDGLDALEQRANTTSWDKAAFYVERFDQLASEEEFRGKRGQALSRAINRRLDADAVRRGKTIPRPSFRSDALKLGQVWPEIFLVDKKLLSYEQYRHIAVCSLPREQKDAIRADAEHDQPNQDALRKTMGFVQREAY
jgi:hypothetical protein